MLPLIIQTIIIKYYWVQNKNTISTTHTKTNNNNNNNNNTCDSRTKLALVNKFYLKIIQQLFNEIYLKDITNLAEYVNSYKQRSNVSLLRYIKVIKIEWYYKDLYMDYDKKKDDNIQQQQIPFLKMLESEHWKEWSIETPKTIELHSTYPLYEPLRVMLDSCQTTPNIGSENIVSLSKLQFDCNLDDEQVLNNIPTRHHSLKDLRISTWKLSHNPLDCWRVLITNLSKQPMPSVEVLKLRSAYTSHYFAFKSKIWIDMLSNCFINMKVLTIDLYYHFNGVENSFYLRFISFLKSRSGILINNNSNNNNNKIKINNNNKLIKLNINTNPISNRVNQMILIDYLFSRECTINRVGIHIYTDMIPSNQRCKEAPITELKVYLLIYFDNYAEMVSQADQMISNFKDIDRIRFNIPYNIIITDLLIEFLEKLQVGLKKTIVIDSWKILILKKHLWSKLVASRSDHRISKHQLWFKL